MRIELLQQTRCELIQALQLCGGMTESIFPQVEAWLLVETDHQKALLVLDDKDCRLNYHSMMDFLFCELFPAYKKICKKFYDGNGKPLRDLISVQEVLLYNDVLLKALEVAYKLFRAARVVSWSSYRVEVARSLIAA